MAESTLQGRDPDTLTALRVAVIELIAQTQSIQTYDQGEGWYECSAMRHFARSIGVPVPGHTLEAILDRLFVDTARRLVEAICANPNILGMLLDKLCQLENLRRGSDEITHFTREAVVAAIRSLQLDVRMLIAHTFGEETLWIKVQQGTELTGAECLDALSFGLILYKREVIMVSPPPDPSMLPNYGSNPIMRERFEVLDGGTGTAESSDSE